MELGWLLDDAIDNLRGSTAPRLRSRKMQQILTIDTRMAGDVTVSMRIDMGSLDRLWQRRIRERCHPALGLRRLLA